MDAVGSGESMDVGGGKTGVAVMRGGVGSGVGVGGVSSSDTAGGSGVGLSSGYGVLVSGNGSPVGVLVEVSVGFSDLASGFGVELDGGFSSAGLAFGEGTGMVLGGNGGVNGGGLSVTMIHTVD